MKAVRPQSLAKNIVVIDGFSTAGKSLFAPLLSSLKRGEPWQINHLYEYLCALDASGRMTRDAAAALMKLYADLDLYNARIGRNANMRPDDVSGPEKNLWEAEFQKRLMTPDGDGVVDKIRQDDPILFLMVHYNFGVSESLFEAFGERLKLYILMVRHPLWLVENWQGGNYLNGEKWQDRFGSHPRDFQFCMEVHGHVVPWFAAEWADEYISLKPWEQAVRVVEYFLRSFEKAKQKLSQNDRAKVAYVPYELFAAKPEYYLEWAAAHLGTRTTETTDRLMTKLKLPRAFKADEVEAKRVKIKSCLSDEGGRSGAAESLEKLCRDYEKSYLSGKTPVFAQTI